MIAAVLTKPGNFALQEVAVPTIKEGEIKIRVEGCGVCASSIPLWEGREWFNYPMQPGSPGHEGWGIVEDIGENISNVQQGDRVTYLSFNAYAAYDVANAGSYVKLPQQLNNKPFPGEPLGCAINIFNRSGIAANDVVAIVGMGFLGALLCQLIKNKGAKVIAVSQRRYSLLNAQKYGADETILLTSTWEVSNKVGEITGNAYCTKVIEATGKQAGIDIATAIVAEGGKIIIAGYHQDGLRQVNMQQWNWKGIDVINAHERNPQKYLTGMQQAIEAVCAGSMCPDPLYTDILSINDINKGFEMTTQRPDGFMKVLITL